MLCKHARSGSNEDKLLQTWIESVQGNVSEWAQPRLNSETPQWVYNLVRSTV